MNVNAKVIKSDGAFAIVESERRSACEGCHKKDDGCSVCSLTGTNKSVSIRAKNDIGADEGDLVEVETKTKTVLFYAFIVFILPVIVAVLFYGGSTYFGIAEKWLFIPAVLGFFATYFFLWLYSKTVVAQRCDAEIVKIIKKKNED